ncbi:NAD(P)H-hydrate dehydratase [Ruminococcus sp. HUN007]|uniref:NAD(P)H-hydrate dehydratase n=1 Tax=Ruminococcus sp. HUN007 TaxID=1514668 RepID=UPI000678E984|nr:NAD(P)H-hydrate dehydratase [Ruminococcus sp. HUN007]
MTKQSVNDHFFTVTDREFVKRHLVRRSTDSHKGTYGTLLSVTGCRNMPGAAVLSGKAALRSGLGLLRQCAVPAYIGTMAAAFPEPVYIPVKCDKDGYYTEENAEMLIAASEKSDAVLIGCGLGCTDSTKALVRRLIPAVKCPIVIDADGLNCIADDPDILCRASHQVIITPHPAEAGRLAGCSTKEIQSDRMKTVRRFTERFPEVITVLKGAGTLTAAGNSVFENPTGNPGMSTGGSGDVLAGIAASFAAQNRGSGSLFDLTVSAVWIHGRAGDLAAEHLSEFSMLPEDIISSLGMVFRELVKQQT